MFEIYSFRAGILHFSMLFLTLLETTQPRARPAKRRSARGICMTHKLALLSLTIKAGFLRRGRVHGTRSCMWMLTRSLCLCSRLWENISTHSHTSTSLPVIANLKLRSLNSRQHQLSLLRFSFSGVIVC